MSRPGWMLLGALGLTAFLGACGLLPQTGPPATAEGRWTAPTWHAWAAQGRFAVQRSDAGFNGGFRWRQTENGYDIRLTGPFGQGGVRIQGDGHGVVLVTDDGRHDSAADPERLLARHLGWSLPVSGLRYWVRGEAEPGHPARWQRDAQGRPRRLSQSGWDIAYLAYRAAEGAALPRLVRLVRGEFEVRLVIDRWVRLDD